MINGKDQEIITINKTGNSILNNAKYSADNTDEWYTTYETIAEELSHYKNQFIDKVVLCNCDDPFESNFCYYFLRHFNQLKLKKLICTSYSGSKIDQLELKSALSSIRICSMVASSTPCSRNTFSSASFQIRHFLSSRPLLYAILFSSNQSESLKT